MNQQEPQAPRRVRPKPRMAQVNRIERLTPHVVGVTFTGDELDGFTTRGPAEHLKVFFPAPGEDRPALPAWGPDGPMYVEGQPRPTSRTYTPRRWRAERRELEVEFVLHGEGPGSGWAASARPGDVVAVGGAGGAYRIDPAADWYLIAGDDTAVPAIGTLLEALPPSARAFVYAEVLDAAEEQKLGGQGRAEVTWLHRGPQSGSAGRLLEHAVREFKLPAGEGRVWVACEASVMRDIRRHLLTERGMDRAQIHTHGYWKYGTVNHPDHDLGDDV
jgi:NADPH-dependent ferric siderophore reductase